MRVAIVHDKLMQFGGGERVAAALSHAFDDADIFTSAYDPLMAARAGLGEVRGTFLQRAPFLERTHHYFLPLYSRAFKSLDLSGYDAVVSSSAFFAKCVQPPPGVPHVCYCHTPIRFLWDLSDSIVAELPNRAPMRAAVKAMIPFLRRADHGAAQRVDVFVANSNHVAERISRFYQRDALVVPPPVEVDHYRADFPRGDYLLVAARLYPYKRLDLAIEVAERLGLRLKIAGDGPDLERLRSLAGPGVEFLGWVEEAKKPELFGSARAFLAPQLEDFGIAMVEAIAAGTPVVALADGGAIDIVDPGVSGELVAAQDADAFCEAVAQIDASGYDRERMRAGVERFSPAHFADRMREIVYEAAELPRPAEAIASR